MRKSALRPGSIAPEWALAIARGFGKLGAVLMLNQAIVKYESLWDVILFVGC